MPQPDESDGSYDVTGYDISDDDMAHPGATYDPYADADAYPVDVRPQGDAATISPGFVVGTAHDGRVSVGVLLVLVRHMNLVDSWVSSVFAARKAARR